MGLACYRATQSTDSELPLTSLACHRSSRWPPKLSLYLISFALLRPMEAPYPSPPNSPLPVSPSRPRSSRSLVAQACCDQDRRFVHQEWIHGAQPQDYVDVPSGEWFGRPVAALSLVDRSWRQATVPLLFRVSFQSHQGSLDVSTDTVLPLTEHLRDRHSARRLLSKHHCPQLPPPRPKARLPGQPVVAHGPIPLFEGAHAQAANPLPRLAPLRLSSATSSEIAEHRAGSLQDNLP